MEQNQYEKRGPEVETAILKSKDGRYIIHRTIITDIKPVKYYEKVLEPGSGGNIPSPSRKLADIQLDMLDELIHVPWTMAG